jgi:hypothetical protein
MTVPVAAHEPSMPGASESNSELLEVVQSGAPYVMEKRDVSQNWLSKGNLANSAQLKRFERVYLPINVNIFAVGLNGDGNLGVKIPDELMGKWLEHLDHTVPHTFVNLHEGPAEHHKVLRMPNSAEVRYRYRFTYVDTAPSVLHVVERYLNSHHRKLEAVGVVNGQYGGGRTSKTKIQVDPDFLTFLLDDLVRHLGLENSGYNIFVLNPRASWLSNLGTDFEHFQSIK